MFKFKCDCGFESKDLNEMYKHMGNYKAPHEGFKTKLEWQNWNKTEVR